MRLLKRWICGYVWHNLHVKFESGHVSLACWLCDHASPGWTLDRPAPRPLKQSSRPAHVIGIARKGKVA
jgi:hypothetical protein